MRTRRPQTEDDAVYWSVLIALGIVVLVLGGLLLLTPFSIARCLIYDRTGSYCPGCGCTRALLALLRGDVLASLRCNPTVIYGAGMTAAYLLTQTVWRLSGRRFPLVLHYRPAWLQIGIALLLGTCLLRNILKFGFHIVTL